MIEKSMFPRLMKRRATGFIFFKYRGFTMAGAGVSGRRLAPLRAGR